MARFGIPDPDRLENPNLAVTRPANIQTDPYDPKFYVNFEFEVRFHILYVLHKNHELQKIPAEPTLSARSMDRPGTTELTRASNSPSNFDPSNQKLGPEH